MTTMVLPPSKSAIRNEALMFAEGYFAETGQRCLTNPVAMATGITYLTAIGLAAGDIVTNLLLACSVGGSGYSGINMKVGVYDKNGNRLRVSGDVSASFGTGAITCALTTPLLIPTTDGYYIAVLAIASTMPTLYRGSTTLGGGTFTGGTISAHARATAQTDLTDPVAFGQGSQNQAIWTGVN